MHKTNEIISGTRTHPPTSQGITPSSYPRMWFIVKPFPSCRARQHTHILSKPTVLVLQPAEHNAEQISGQSYPNATVEHLTRFVCSHCSRINKNLGTHLSINSMCPFLTYFLSFFLSFLRSFLLVTILLCTTHNRQQQKQRLLVLEWHSHSRYECRVSGRGEWFSRVMLFTAGRMDGRQV